MDEFQLYIVDSKIFGDPTPNKRRPSVLQQKFPTRQKSEQRS